MSGAEDLPEELRARIDRLTRRCGKPLLLRAACWPDPRLRGRISRRAGAIVVEYRDEGAGYFWHLDLIAELLGYVEQGYYQLSLHDAEDPTLLAGLFRPADEGGLRAKDQGSRAKDKRCRRGE